MLSPIPKEQRDAKYAALACDGVSCTVCHHSRLDPAVPIGDTCTGDFRLTAPEEVYGPFENPKPLPMEQALGITPKYDPTITSSVQSTTLPDADFVGGSDALIYRIPLRDLRSEPASVKTTPYYQAIPPFYLQDRFCTTGNQPDTQRLHALTSHLQLDGTRAANWKLYLVSSGVVPLVKP